MAAPRSSPLSVSAAAAAPAAASASLGGGSGVGTGRSRARLGCVFGSSAAVSALHVVLGSAVAVVSVMYTTSHPTCWINTTYGDRASDGRARFGSGSGAHRDHAHTGQISNSPSSRLARQAALPSPVLCPAAGACPSNRSPFRSPNPAIDHRRTASHCDGQSESSSETFPSSYAEPAMLYNGTTERGTFEETFCAHFWVGRRRFASQPEIRVDRFESSRWKIVARHSLGRVLHGRFRTDGVPSGRLYQRHLAMRWPMSQTMHNCVICGLWPRTKEAARQTPRATVGPHAGTRKNEFTSMKCKKNSRNGNPNFLFVISIDPNGGRMGPPQKIWCFDCSKRILRELCDGNEQ